MKQKNHQKKTKPILNWQVGNYAKTQDLHFHIPYSFLLLCKLWNTTPEEILSDFMDNLSCGSWKREGRDKAKEQLINYAIEMNYGQVHYTKEDITQMFTELNAIGLLWPQNAKLKIIETHARWRDNYYNYWFKKWYKKYHRKPRSNTK